MISTFKRLLTAIDYLRISHEAKHRYDYTIPTLFALAMISCYYFIPIKPSILGKDGIISNINSIIQILTGFYIASLAAVATFKTERLDEVMEGRPPKLKGINGKTELLTRRRFLCLLFAYLVTLCFLLVFIGIIAPTVSANLRDLVPALFVYIKYVSLSIYIFLVSQLTVVTLLGIFFITDKIHAKKMEENITIREVAPEEVEPEEWPEEE